MRVHLRHEVRRLQRQLGITTIMVTHDQEEALTMADRIVVMDHGVIVQVGTPTEVYREPETRFVADFVGTINFLAGVVLGTQRVRLGRVELHCARNLDGFEEGAAVNVCIRPEDLVVRDAGRNTPNAVSARVHELEFLGAFYRVTLAVEGMDDLPIIADFMPNMVQEHGIRQGAEVTIVFPDDCIRVFSNP